jgi:nucleotide-binding universal stress UspA family protein
MMAMAQDTEADSQPQAPDRNEAESPVIVVGLDGSPSSWNAFYWAAGEALRVNSRIVAVHVIPLADTAGAFAVPIDYAGLEQARQQVSDELQRDATHRAHELGVALSFVTEHGDATYALTNVAHGLHANLIVVGRSAKVLHHLAGSISHRLTCRKDAPVVVVVP